MRKSDAVDPRKGEGHPVFGSGVRGQESISLDLQFAGVECSAAEDMARQEYALSSELQYQVQQFGVGHRGQYGEQDFSMLDLTQALAVVEEASQEWLRLPKIVRDRYGSWAAVEAASRSGELEQLLRTAGAPAGSSGGAPAVPASDSAPVSPPKAG